MNCQEINRILDSHPKRDLEADTDRRINQHLSSCESCRDAWAAFDSVATMTIPEMPRGLRSRLVAALAAQVPVKSRHVRRSTLFGGALIFGAAIAASLVFRSENTASDTSKRIDEAARAAASASPPEPQSQGVAEPPATAASVDELGKPDFADTHIGGR